MYDKADWKNIREEASAKVATGFCQARLLTMTSWTPLRTDWKRSSIHFWKGTSQRPDLLLFLLMVDGRAEGAEGPFEHGADSSHHCQAQR